MSTTRIEGGYALAQVQFVQRPTDGRFGYLFCKSDVSGGIRSFAVGVKTTGSVSEVWVFHLPQGRTDHVLTKYRSPNGIMFTDGAVHNVSVQFTGVYHSVAIDGIVVGSGALSMHSPISDVTNPVFNVGQRAPGRFEFSGVIRELSIFGFQRVVNRATLPAVSIGRMWRREGEDTVGVGFNVPSVSATFSVAVSILMESGSRGYVMSRTDVSGSVRAYSVYVPRTGRVRLYYRTAGISRNLVAYFDTVVINDGRIHALMLTVTGTTARLHVDGHVATAALVGSISDCTGTNCVFHVGQRSDGIGRVAWVIRGVVGGVAVHPTAAHNSFPTHGSFQTVSLVGTAFGVLSGDATSASGGGISFNGAGHFELSSSVDVFTHNTNPSLVSFTFTQTGAGYLIAHSDSSGMQRWFAVYSGNTAFTVYFRSGGAQLSQRFSHTVSFNATTTHTVAISLADAALSVSLDGVILGSVAVPQGLDSCTADGGVCATWIGRRQPSNFGFSGVVHYAVAHSIL